MREEDIYNKDQDVLKRNHDTREIKRNMQD
jgi:hypothetical protein